MASANSAGFCRARGPTGHVHDLGDQVHVAGLGAGQDVVRRVGGQLRGLDVIRSAISTEGKEAVRERIAIDGLKL